MSTAQEPQAGSAAEPLDPSAAAPGAGSALTPEQQLAELQARHAEVSDAWLFLTYLASTITLKTRI